MNGITPCFVTTVELADNGTIIDTRCVGYFTNMYQAQTVVRENSCDIHETCYNWAVIESFPAGLYPQASYEIWYQWCKKERKYVLSAKPKVLEHTLNFGIG